MQLKIYEFESNLDEFEFALDSENSLDNLASIISISFMKNLNKTHIGLDALDALFHAIYIPFGKAVLLLLAVFSVSSAKAQTWDELIKITASDASGGERFGDEVAIDGNYAIVTALFDSDAGVQTGSAYVFELVGGVWTEVQKLNASDMASNDRYGSDVAIHGDRAVIGAHYNDGVGENSGAAYIYERDEEGSWNEIQKITATDEATYGHFGEACALSDDLILIGSPGIDGFSGGVYLFEENDEGDWIEVQKLTASDGEDWDGFGNDVDILEDLIVVGARMHDSEELGANHGTAYLFEENDEGLWTETHQFFASDIGSNDRFGSSISISEDCILIGAPDADNVGTNDGAAYVFELNELEEWVETQILTASDAEEHDTFGREVCISGDFAVITSAFNDDHGYNSGSAYIFERSEAGEWTEIEKITASDADEEDWFGLSGAISDNHVIIGAIKDEGGAVSSGSAYIFQGCADLDVVPYSSELCLGESVVLDAVSAFGADVSWTGEVINGEGFVPPLGLSTYTATGGEEDCAFQAVINVLESPTVTIVEIDSVLCSGDEIILSGEGALTYEWNEAVEDGVAFIPAIGETNYTVIGTNDFSCSDSATITVVVNDLPMVIATAADATLCDGDEAILVGEGALTYSWDGGVVDGVSFVPPLGETDYTVIGTDANDCENSATITITVHDLPIVTASADNEIVCEDESVTLTGSGAIIYNWDGGVTDGVAFIPPVGETVYTVTGIDDNECENTAEIAIVVFAKPAVSIAELDDDVLCEGTDGMLLSGTPLGGAFSGSGMTGSQFDPDLAGIGDHTVYYSYENEEGCSNTDSVTITVVNCLGLPNENKLSFSIYPNPLSNQGIIQFDQQVTADHYITVYNLLGEEVLRIDDIAGTTVEISKQTVGTGIYMVVLNDQDQPRFITKLIVQ